MGSFKSKFYIAAKRGELVRSEKKFSLPPATPATAGTGSNRVLPILVTAFNRVIGEPCIYEPARFQGVALRPETSDQIRQGATVPNRVSLNRMLLEDAYPVELLRNQKNQEAVKAAVIELVGANLRLVVKAASNYRNSYLDIEELTFEGNLGLITAAERFDPGKGCRFSTYATWWIQQCIRLAANKAHTIRTPIRRAAQIAKIQSATSFDPDTEDQDTAKISLETDIREEDVKKLLKNRTQLLPLDAPLSDSDGCTSMQNAIPSNEMAADAHLMTSERDEKLKELLETIGHPHPRHCQAPLRVGHWTAPDAGRDCCRLQGHAGAYSPDAAAGTQVPATGNSEAGLHNIPGRDCEGPKSPHPGQVPGGGPLQEAQEEGDWGLFP